MTNKQRARIYLSLAKKCCDSSIHTVYVCNELCRFNDDATYKNFPEFFPEFFLFKPDVVEQGASGGWWSVLNDNKGNDVRCIALLLSYQMTKQQLWKRKTW